MYEMEYKRRNPEDAFCMSTVQGEIVCKFDNVNKRYGENVILSQGNYSAELRNAIEKRNAVVNYGSCKTRNA